MARRLILWLSMLACPGLAAAQLSDPTRPPQQLAQPDDAGVVAGTGGLQTVILRQNAKPAALINGEVVELGGMVGEARLVKVGEDFVVLKGPQGEETLRLINAAVEKKMVVEKKPRKANQ